MIKFETPLQWLPQQPRTKRPKRARFGTHSPYKAGGYLIEELKRLNAKKIVISSNLQQRARGEGFLSNQIIDDAGIVVYFELKGVGKAMACDLWTKVEHNLWALYLSICAIRGLERWGGSEFLDGLFTGFKALPFQGTSATETDYFKGIENEEHLKERYKKLAKELHPDLGGDEEQFSIMQRQFKQREGNYQ